MVDLDTVAVAATVAAGVSRASPIISEGWCAPSSQLPSSSSYSEGSSLPLERISMSFRLMMTSRSLLSFSRVGDIDGSGEAGAELEGVAGMNRDAGADDDDDDDDW